MSARQQKSLQNGRTVGNYIITKNLGEGTFGKVKLGIHSLTGEKVAVKILEKSKIVDVADVERVTREIHILKQIRHPNVIQLYEIIETPKQLFLVMEYVSEGELFEHIVKKKRLKQSEACQFFRQLLSGVEYLHELNIVHRDLKPQNLLIDFNKRLKLVDFGLSNTYKSRGGQGEMLKTACGSPCYAAPEMIAGKKYLGLNADIWSCGVVLFAMVCGYLPFEDPNTTVLYKKIISGEFSIPKFVSPAAKELLQGILTTDPERRFKLKDIKNSAWYRQVSDSSTVHLNGIKVGVQSIPVDEQILCNLKQFNENVEEARKFIENNRHNHTITVYYLLLKKNLRNGVHSPYDICSNAFDQTKLPKKENEKSQKTQKMDNDLQEIDLDRMTTAIGQRGNRMTSRLTHLRKDKEKEKDIFSNRDSFMASVKKPESLQLAIENLPAVGSSRQTSQKRRFQSKITAHQRQQPQEVSLYDIDQPIVEKSKFNQTMVGSWRKHQPVRGRAESKNSRAGRESSRGQERYTSLEVPDLSGSLEKDQQKEDRKIVSSMNRTFMGRIPKAYIPRWQNESERIRSILNTTISGHGKRKAHPKLNIFY